MPENIEGVSSITDNTRARFFELTVVQVHRVKELQIVFLTADGLAQQHPDLWCLVTTAFMSFRQVYSQHLRNEVLLREVTENVYHEGRLHVLINQLKRELTKTQARQKGEAPEVFQAAYYHLSTGNLTAALSALANYPNLLERLIAMIEESFPGEALQKIRRSQGFTVLQLGTLSGISTQHLEHMEREASACQTTALEVKARLIQHLFAQSFR